MNGANYLDMLQTYAIPAIADIPNLVFQQEPLHTGPGRSGLILMPLLGMPGLDMEALLLGPLGLQISHLLDFVFGDYVKDRVYKSAANDIDHPKEKIQEAVRSVTADNITMTWRELYKCLVFMVEHNGDHVEAYHHH